MLNFSYTTKRFVFFVILVSLCVSLINCIKSQSVKRYYMSHNKVKHNFSTSIKIIDLSRLKKITSSSSYPITVSSLTTTKGTKLIKKRKKIKLKRKKLQRISNGKLKLILVFICKIEYRKILRSDFHEYPKCLLSSLRFKKINNLIEIQIMRFLGNCQKNNFVF